MCPLRHKPSSGPIPINVSDKGLSCGMGQTTWILVYENVLVCNNLD